MAEYLYTGLLGADEMPQIVASCHFTSSALLLAEELPQQLIANPQKGRELLHFMPFAEELAHISTSCASGRIFQEDRELRWERQRGGLRVVYLGEAEEQQFAGRLQADRNETLTRLRRKDEPTWYALFGKRLGADDLRQLGGVARPGDFAVLRLPGLLRYPVKNDGQKYARLAVREYLNAQTNHVELFRFQQLETYDGERG